MPKEDDFYLKYRWELLRRNDKYRDDWKDYWEIGGTNELLKQMLLKWGPLSYPQHKSFEVPFDEIPRYEDTQVVSKYWPKRLASKIKRCIGRNYIEFSKNSIEVDYDQTLRIKTKEPREVRLSYCDYRTGKRGLLTEENIDDIPKELNITIKGFDQYLHCCERDKKLYMKRILENIKHYINYWGKASKLLNIDGISPRLKVDLDESLYLYDLFDSGLEACDVVKEFKWTEKDLDVPIYSTDEEYDKLYSDYYNSYIKKGKSEDEARRLTDDYFRRAIQIDDKEAINKALNSKAKKRKKTAERWIENPSLIIPKGATIAGLSWFDELSNYPLVPEDM